MILSLNNIIQVVSKSQINSFAKILVDPVIENVKENLSEKQFIIIGGGDLTIASYILKEYPQIKKLVVIEIDE